MATSDYKISDKLLQQVRSRDIRGIKKSLRNRADINALSPNGEFALKIAAESDEYYSVAKLLLKKKANVNSTDTKGKSALMVACENGCFEVTTLLLSKEAQVNFQDESQRTALILCTYVAVIKWKGTSGLRWLSFCWVSNLMLTCKMLKDDHH